MCGRRNGCVLHKSIFITQLNFGEKSFGLTKKTFSTDGYNAQWVHRLPGGRHEPSNLSRSRHSTRNTIYVWDVRLLIGLVYYTGPVVNMHSYMDILTDQMVQFARDTFPLPDNEDPLLIWKQYSCFMHDGFR
jgi:hypothetical protein